MSQSKRRTALVTGGNRGIGLEVCRQLAQRDHRVLLGARTPASASAAIAAMQRDGLDVTAVRLDIDSAGDIAALRTLVERQFGALDVLVNNAAVLIGEETGILDASRDDLVRTFATNVHAQVAICQAFVPAMVTRRSGRVVNVSSQAGQLKTMSNYAPVYSMSKAALNAFTRILAATVSDSGVLVNCVNPGWVRTDMGGPHAPRSVQKGAETIVWAAMLPNDGPTGQFFTDKHEMEW